MIQPAARSSAVALISAPPFQVVKVINWEALENVVMTEAEVDAAKAEWPEERYVGLLQGGFPLVPHVSSVLHAWSSTAPAFGRRAPFYAERRLDGL